MIFIGLPIGIPLLDGRAGGELTSTIILHKPVDYQLAGEPLYKESGREWEIPAYKKRKQHIRCDPALES